MDEYSRIVIEKYCMDHPTTKKADFLWDMVLYLTGYLTRIREDDLEENISDGQTALKIPNAEVQ